MKEADSEREEEGERRMTETARERERERRGRGGEEEEEEEEGVTEHCFSRAGREQRLLCVQCWESEVEPGLRECLTVYTDCIPAMWLQDAFNLYSGNGLNSSLSSHSRTLYLSLFSLFAVLRFKTFLMRPPVRLNCTARVPFICFCFFGEFILYNPL